jgi:hypothetical protein
LRFAGSTPKAPTGENKLPGVTSYLTGNRDQWIHGISNYDSVRYLALSGHRRRFMATRSMSSVTSFSVRERIPTIPGLHRQQMEAEDLADRCGSSRPDLVAE